MLYIRYLIIVSGHNIQKISFVNFHFCAGVAAVIPPRWTLTPCPVAWLHITDMGDMGGCSKIP